MDQLQEIEKILGRPLLAHEKNFLLLASEIARAKKSYAKTLTMEQQREWLSKKNSRPRKKVRGVF